MIEKNEKCFLAGEFHDWDDIFDQTTPSQLVEELLLHIKASENHALKLNDAYEKNYELARQIERLERDLADARNAIHVVKLTMRQRYDMAVLAQCRHECECSKEVEE